MPIGPAHRRQASKNWLLFALLIVLVGAIYSIAIVRVKQAGEAPQAMMHK